MNFASNFFITLLLPLVIIVSVLLRHKIKIHNAFIILFNIAFLLFNGIGGTVLLVVTCIVDYFIVLLISKNRVSSLSKFVFVFGIILNVLPLLFFKYTGFLIGNLNSIFGTSIICPAIVSPVGISFYTFQAISLISDVKTNKISNRPKLFEVIFYLSFFATITSGPILRFDLVQRQFVNRIIQSDNINKGVHRIVIGLSKKIILANNLAIFVDYFFSNVGEGGSISMLGYWMASIAFSLQLYLDFSGYSDIAIGIAKLLGFSIPENFDYPYISKSIQEFWKRWHISLSQWFRDYIYIPLGGNRVSKHRHIINLLIVWLLTGLWHGSDWTFIIWGLLYFVLLVFEKYTKKLHFIGSPVIGRIYTLFFVNLLWVVFRSDSIEKCVTFLSGMFGINSFSIPVEMITISVIPIILCSGFACIPFKKLFRKVQHKSVCKAVDAVALAGMFILSVFFIANSSFVPFIYGKF